MNFKRGAISRSSKDDGSIVGFEEHMYILSSTEVNPRSDRVAYVPITMQYRRIGRFPKWLIAEPGKVTRTNHNTG
jgi:hypothetical protein